MVIVSLEHQHPILKMIAQPRLFILLFLCVFFCQNQNSNFTSLLSLLLLYWHFCYWPFIFAFVFPFARVLAIHTTQQMDFIQLNCRFFPRIHCIVHTNIFIQRKKHQSNLIILCTWKRKKTITRNRDKKVIFSWTSFVNFQ